MPRVFSRDEVVDLVKSLDPQQHEVLTLLCHGKTNQDIATESNLTLSNLENRILPVLYYALKIRQGYTTSQKDEALKRYFRPIVLGLPNEEPPEWQASQTPPPQSTPTISPPPPPGKTKRFAVLQRFPQVSGLLYGLTTLPLVAIVLYLALTRVSGTDQPPNATPLPTQAAKVAEVTRVVTQVVPVEVTKIVEVIREITPTPAPVTPTVVQAAAVIPAPIATIPAPTATAIPATPTVALTPGVLYQADFAQGWGGQGWKLLGKDMLFDGSIASRSSGPKFHLASAVIAPFEPPTADYAVEAEIQVINFPTNFTDTGFGLIARSETGDLDRGGYAGVVCSSSRSVYLVNTEYIQGDFKVDKSFHTYRLEVRGNKISYYIDGSLKVTAQDNKYLEPGRVAVSASRAQIQVRSFKVLALK